MAKQTPEGKVKAQVKKYLDALAPDVRYYMPVPSIISAAGEPDFDVCFFGRWVSIECKANKLKHPTLLQQATMQSICNAHGVSLVIDIDNIERQLQWLSDFAIHIQTENLIFRDALLSGSISRPTTTEIIR